MKNVYNVGIFTEGKLVYPIYSKVAEVSLLWTCLFTFLAGEIEKKIELPKGFYVAYDFSDRLKMERNYV